MHVNIWRGAVSPYTKERENDGEGSRSSEWSTGNERDIHQDGRSGKVSGTLAATQNSDFTLGRNVAAFELPMQMRADDSPVAGCSYAVGQTVAANLPFARGARIPYPCSPGRNQYQGIDRHHRPIDQPPRFWCHHLIVFERSLSLARERASVKRFRSQTHLRKKVLRYRRNLFKCNRRHQCFVVANASPQEAE